MKTKMKKAMKTTVHALAWIALCSAQAWAQELQGEAKPDARQKATAVADRARVEGAEGTEEEVGMDPILARLLADPKVIQLIEKLNELHPAGCLEFRKRVYGDSVHISSRSETSADASVNLDAESEKYRYFGATSARTGCPDPLPDSESSTQLFADNSVRDLLAHASVLAALKKAAVPHSGPATLRIGKAMLDRSRSSRSGYRLEIESKTLVTRFKLSTDFTRSYVLSMSEVESESKTEPASAR